MEVANAFWTGRTALVTGGTGFLGRAIVNALQEAGARVRSLSLPPKSPAAFPRDRAVDWYFGDIRDASLVQRAALDAQVIFHTAGVVGDWGATAQEIRQIHQAGTMSVLAAARNARVVHTSSIVTLGGSKGPRVLGEDTPRSAVADLPYVEGKRAAEDLALAAAADGRDIVITLPGYLVGPDDSDGSVMGRLLKRYWKGRMPLAMSGGYSVADVRDVARGHLLAAEHGQAGRRYILAGANLSFRELLDRLAAAAGYVPRGTWTVPASAAFALAALAEARASWTGSEPYPSRAHVRLHARYWYASSDRARAELGYHCRSIDETLRDTYSWFQSRGHIALRGVNRWWMRPALAVS